jgi:hypothetical protein
MVWAPLRRHQGDDPAPLKEAEDALTRALDDGLDVFLGKSRRRVKNGRTAVAPPGGPARPRRRAAASPKLTSAMTRG